MPGGDFHPSVQYYTYVRSQAHPLSDKADRFCFGLKVQLRLKPPEESPAQAGLSLLCFRRPGPEGRQIIAPGKRSAARGYP